MALKVLYAMMVLGCSGEDDVNGKSRAVPSLMVSEDKTLPGVSSLAGIGPGSLGEIGKLKMLQKEDRACPSGYADITTQEACIAAASDLGERFFHVAYWYSFPGYCFKWGGHVNFNTNPYAFDPDQDAQKICQAATEGAVSASEAVPPENFLFRTKGVEESMVYMNLGAVIAVFGVIGGGVVVYYLMIRRERLIQPPLLG